MEGKTTVWIRKSPTNWFVDIRSITRWINKPKYYCIFIIIRMGACFLLGSSEYELSIYRIRFMATVERFVEISKEHNNLEAFCVMISH